MRQAVESTAAERNYGALAHAAPLVVVLALWWWKRESVYVTTHVRASVNFQLTMLVCYGLGIGYAHVHSVFGLTLLVSSALLEAVSVVLAARRAKAGGYYEYRMCLRFVKQGHENDGNGGQREGADGGGKDLGDAGASADV